MRRDAKIAIGNRKRRFTDPRRK